MASSPSFSDVIVVHRFHCDCLLTMLLAFALPPFGLLELPPSIERLIINVGSNDDPLLSPDNQTGAIAFEPIVGCKIKPSPRLWVVPAAVAASDGISSMRVVSRLTVDAVASSLAKPTAASLKYSHEHDMKLVPTIAMKNFLSLIPVHVELWHMKTDMQGYDALALSNAGSALRRLHYINSETWLSRSIAYEDAHNDFCEDLWPIMRRQGFRLVALFDRHKFSDQLTPESLKHAKLHGPSAEAQAVKVCNQWATKDLAVVRSHIAWEGEAYFMRNDTTMPLPPTYKGCAYCQSLRVAALRSQGGP